MHDLARLYHYTSVRQARNQYISAVLHLSRQTQNGVPLYVPSERLPAVSHRPAASRCGRLPRRWSQHMLHPCQCVPLAYTQGKFPIPCRGTSGFVQLALDLRTGQEVAIKFIHRGPGAPQFDAQHITRELLNHRMVGRHPNIVQLLEVRPLALLYTRPRSCLLGGEQRAAPRPSGHRSEAKPRAVRSGPCSD